MLKRPVSVEHDLSRQFVVRIFALDVSLGRHAATRGTGKATRPVLYGSRTLNNAERNYSETELGCLAFVWVGNNLSLYLYRNMFVLQSGAQPLHYWCKVKHTSCQCVRWSFLLKEYMFRVVYFKGNNNLGADFLRRA